MSSSMRSSRGRRRGRRPFVILAATAMVASLLPTAALAQDFPTSDDPRVGLGGGFADAEEASLGLDLVGSFDKADGGFFNPANVGSFDFANSDIAFTGDSVIQGNFAGFQIHDISDPSNPTLRTEVLCPGGQGDATIYGDLLFTSVEGANGRVDCGTQGNPGGAQEDRARGVRIWDISDLDNPEQLAVVQTCRGSHTHRLVEDVNDDSVVYIYNNGTGGQRNAGEAVSTPDGIVAGRCGQGLTSDNPSTHMIEVIEVPLDDPASASVVNEARLFADADTGAVNGLQNGPTQPQHPCATDAEGFCSPAFSGYSPSPNTNTCHDITVYPEIGLAAGACQGNGLLIDIADPSDPQRIDVAADANFSYWHSANFNNDGTSVMFTDEWGGGTGARCAPNHRTSWGANALFSIDRSGDTPRMTFESYYKLPVEQTNAENCVAHQANIVPVPGRDILVQGWYQGGISMFDWTDPANPFEIAYFDRGPINPAGVVLGGYWSGYWYNGNIIGSEIARGLDAFEMAPTDDLTANEIAAANTITLDEHNAMSMRSFSWDPSFEVVRAFRDQAERAGLAANHVANVDRFVERAERFQSGPQARAAVANLNAVANQVRGDAPDLAESLDDLAADLG